MGIHSCSICGNSNPGKLHVLEMHDVEMTKFAAFCQDCMSDKDWDGLCAVMADEIRKIKKKHQKKLAYQALPDLFKEGI